MGADFKRLQDELRRLRVPGTEKTRSLLESATKEVDKLQNEVTSLRSSATNMERQLQELRRGNADLTNTLQMERGSLAKERQSRVELQKALEVQIAKVRELQAKLAEANLDFAGLSGEELFERLGKALPTETTSSFEITDVEIDLKAGISAGNSGLEFVLPDLGREVDSTRLSAVKLRFRHKMPAQTDVPVEDLVCVPDLTGMKASAVVGELLEVGLQQGSVVEKVSSLPPGTVLEQVPSGGDLVSRGEKVDITISEAK